MESLLIRMINRTVGVIVLAHYKGVALDKNAYHPSVTHSAGMSLLTQRGLSMWLLHKRLETATIIFAASEEEEEEEEEELRRKRPSAAGCV
ncbi:hypothetical protein Cni_G06689 [Canna indica]|uniref:Uncharacterized protein n=1 Tax=Canna indica TaxID=4628 RepID=A0AAQ3JXH7_9LILI|nr:hypothetical protein Cni_G06689 [Canna indica]